MLSVSFLYSNAQDAQPAFDGHHWKAPYSLPVEGWGIERFLIPINFAPKIPYKGVEDIRFTQGWGNVKSDEYWSYAFLWYLDGKPAINASIIESNLKLYYDGLIGSNIDKKKITAEKITPTKASFKKIKTSAGDLNTFSGSIQILDYMQLKPITFHCLVHHKICGNEDKTFIFYEISPRPVNDSVWIKLNKLWTDFNCTAGPGK